MEPDTVLGDSSLIPVPEPLTIMVTPCTEIQGPPEAYRNQSNPRGALLVANYSSFDSPDSKPRLGSEADAEHITELFRQIGYENTKTIVDATKQDTGKALLEFRNEKIHAEVDSLVVVFMSHGAEEYMCTTDGEIIYDQEVIEYFNNVNCPALKGKPKYFIFQHCRGKKEHIVRAYKMIDNKTSRKISVPRKRNRRELSDVYVCYSTLPGFVSYRYDVHGSPYIDRICRVFMEEAHRKEIDTLMKRVEKAMPEAQPTEIRRLGFKSDFLF
ncbi:caspase-2-like [Penaeus japonicus]|uniref:caspase-2-like n=1 Tax=Penaeus japonicus TaxID=27405 RepID=UPI001C7112DF|nr:caspase-2-like [Penaeus japonicus]